MAGKINSAPRARPAAAGLALLALLALSACEEKVKPTVSASGMSGESATQESWNAEITFTDSGRVTGILHAGHIAAFAEKKITRLDSGLTVDFFDERQRHTSVLTARRGLVDDRTHDFEAHENVVVVSDSGTTLRTEELYWNNTARKIHTPAYVDITSPSERIEGRGFESDQSLKRYTIFKVTGQAKSDD